jgi:hypothetical protein
MTIPDTELAAAATFALRASSPPFLVNHCFRTYAFGRALAVRDRAGVDAEMLWLGAALHDLGLTPAGSGDVPFEERGAAAARPLLIAAGLAEDRADLVAEAIRRHIEPDAAHDPRPEVALVSIGAAVDVLGLRHDRVPADVLRRVVDEYPRLGFKAAITVLLREEVDRYPHGGMARFAALGGAAGIEAAPFAE